MPNLLDDLETLLGKATPGPWAFTEHHEVQRYISHIASTARSNSKTKLQDAELIVALRNSATQLLAALRAAEAWLKADDAFNSGDKFVCDVPDCTTCPPREVFRASLAKLGGGG